MSSQASLHTLAPNSPISPPVNPLHILAAAQEHGDPSTAVHIHKVTDHAVQLQSGNPADTSLVSRVGRAISSAVDSSGHKRTSDAMAHARQPEFAPVDLATLNSAVRTNMKPSPLSTGGALPNGFVPPPSPPSSDSPTEDEDRFPDTSYDEELAIPRSESPRGYADSGEFAHHLSQQPPVVGPLFAPPIRRAGTSADTGTSGESSSAFTSTSKGSIPYPRVTRDRDVAYHPNGLATSAIVVPSSIETPAASDAPPSSYFDQRPMSVQQPSSSKRSSSPSGGDAGLLHPSSAARSARRNTTGSAQPFSHRSSKSITTSTGAGPSLHGGLDAVTAGPLDSDILKEAEQIRKERHSKRAKAQQEAEEAMMGAHRTAQAVQAEAKVLVGNLIGEGHVNYILMYNMLTGIRIGVGLSLIPVHMRF